MALFDKTAQKNSGEESIFGTVLSVFGLPVNQKIIFSNHKNVYKKKIEKRQRKLIVKISFLKFFLHCEENILLLTTGNSPITFWELLLTFPAFFFLKRALLVFTTKRILHIPTTYGYTYRQTISQIPYADCHKIAVRGRSLILDLKNGERQVVSYVGSTELKKIKQLIHHLPIEEGINPDIAIQPLCPSCSNGLSEDPKICPKCRLKFKEKTKTILGSILLPGGGFFYSRHHIYGVLMGLIETAIMISITLAGLNLKKVFTQNNLYLLIFTAIVFISVKAVNAYHSSRMVDYPLPLKTNFQRRKV